MDDLLPFYPTSGNSGLPAVQGGSPILPSRDIVVNGRRCTLRTDHIDHAQLVMLAFPEAIDGASTTSSMTVSYRGGPHSASDGILAPTERTLVANGETFIVVSTDKS